MGYHHVVVDDLAPSPDRPCVQRRIGSAAGLESLAINRYEVDPGEQIPLAYHVHDEQEEVFYVLSGTLTVETPDEDYEVAADEAFVVEPGNPQRAYVAESATDPAVALAVGAPAVDDVHAYDPEDA